MAYLALYRQHRPKTFAEIVEQNHIVKTLSNAIVTGRMSHAYLFTGPRGTGKTSIARILARSLNCLEGPTLTPCGVCSSCQNIDAGTSIDVTEIDAASNRGIDDVRGLRQNLQYMSESRYRIYIIDEVHMLTEPAFNALLKTLEEPPENSILILATTELHKVPLTILSRCQRFDFHRISENGIYQHLCEVAKREKINAEPQALQAIALRAQGGVRDALSLFDQALSYAGQHLKLNDVLELIGSVNQETLNEAIGNMVKGDFLANLRLLNAIEDEGKDLVRFLNDLILTLNSWLVDSQGLHELSKEDIVEMLQVLVETEAEMKFSEQPKLVLELSMFRGGQLVHAKGKIAQLEAKIQRLESLVKSLNYTPKQDSKQQFINQHVVSPLPLESYPQIEEQPIKVKGDLSFMPESEAILERIKPSPPQESPEKATADKESAPVQDQRAQSSSEDVQEEQKNKETDKLRENWDAVLNQIRREKISIHAIFKKGAIHRIDHENLVIVYHSDFFIKTLLKVENKAIIERAVEQKTGLKLKFKPITAEEANREALPSLLNSTSKEVSLNNQEDDLSVDAETEAPAAFDPEIPYKEISVKEDILLKEDNWIVEAALLLAGEDKTVFQSGPQKKN